MQPIDQNSRLIAEKDAVESPTGTAGGDADLRGVSQLIISAVAGVTDIVEDMHRNIATSAGAGTRWLGRAQGQRADLADP